MRRKINYVEALEYPEQIDEIKNARDESGVKSKYDVPLEDCAWWIEWAIEFTLEYGGHSMSDRPEVVLLELVCKNGKYGHWCARFDQAQYKEIKSKFSIA